MKHKKGRGRSSDIESSEDERIIDDPMNDFIVEGEGREEGNESGEDLFENSQDLSQVIPRRIKAEKSPAGSTSPRKKKDKSRKEPTPTPRTTKSRPPTATAPTSSRQINGVRVREVDISEIPEHLISNMNLAETREAEFGELKSEDVEAAATNSNGGVWIIQCPKNVSLGELLTGKKISLRGGTYLFNESDDESAANLTQYAPNSSLGINIANRKFEAISVTSGTYKEGVALLLPDNKRYNMVAAPVHGHIIIRESIQELPVPKIDIPKTKPRTLPVGIKERHAVYGADFTKIVERMESSARKKKKKRHNFDESPEPSCQKLNGFHVTHDTTPQVHVKIEQESESDQNQKRKKKKKKKHHEDDETMIDETNNESQLSSRNTYIYEDNSSGVVVENKKKSKKRKREEEEPTDYLEDTLPFIKKSKKSKR